MTTVTIHADDTFAAAIREAALAAGQSVNKFVQIKLGQALGLLKGGKRARPDFLDFGTPLSRAAAAELRSVQNDFSVVDEEMWK